MKRVLKYGLLAGLALALLVLWVLFSASLWTESRARSEALRALSAYAEGYQCDVSRARIDKVLNTGRLSFKTTAWIVNGQIVQSNCQELRYFTVLILHDGFVDFVPRGNTPPARLIVSGSEGAGSSVTQLP